MEWVELWSWYARTTKETQEDILQQINLREFLQGLSPKYQLEVLEGAPMLVLHSVMNSLHDYTKKYLKIGTDRKVLGVSKEMLQLLDRNGWLLK